MTVFGWDSSHYDGTLTRATLVRARDEGIGFFTHKIGEGAGGDDPGDATALAAARDAGITVIGGYHVVRSGPVSPQVDALVSLADRDEPWWRDFPGWFWQVDLERWPYDRVSASTGIAFGQALRDRTGRLVVMYASHGQYGDQLSGWDGPLWNADYVSHPADGFRDMYPGDDWTPLHGSWRGGWSPYSGQTPTFLQYTSSAVIAGLTTSDANAYRGTLAELTALVTGEEAMSDVYYKIQSADPERNGQVYTSNRIHRRGPLRAPGSIQGPAVSGATQVLLTDAMRGTNTWDSYLDAVAGPPFPTFPALGDGSIGTHTHAVSASGSVSVSGVTGPPSRTAELASRYVAEHRTLSVGTRPGMASGEASPGIGYRLAPRYVEAYKESARSGARRLPSGNGELYIVLGREPRREGAGIVTWRWNWPAEDSDSVMRADPSPAGRGEGVLNGARRFTRALERRILPVGARP